MSVKIKMSVSAIIPISEIRYDIYNFSKFCRENRPISLYRHIGTPLYIYNYGSNRWVKLSTHGYLCIVVDRDQQ